MKQIVKGILETYFRSIGKSPKYFRYIKAIVIAVIVIIGGLTVIHDNQLFELPNFLVKFTGFDSMIMGGLVWFVSSLATQDPEEVKDKVESLTSVDNWAFIPQGQVQSGMNDTVLTIDGVNYNVPLYQIEAASQGLYYLQGNTICTALNNATSQSSVTFQTAGGGPTYIAMPIRRPK